MGIRHIPAMKVLTHLLSQQPNLRHGAESNSQCGLGALPQVPHVRNTITTPHGCTSLEELDPRTCLLELPKGANEPTKAGILDARCAQVPLARVSSQGLGPGWLCSLRLWMSYVLCQDGISAWNLWGWSQYAAEAKRNICAIGVANTRSVMACTPKSKRERQ